MMFLPIVGRELRVAARKRGTYWGRIVFAFVAIVTGSIIFLLNFATSPSTVGKDIFVGLAIIAMLYCVGSGRMSTADCLSEEKRDGTLGLLFLTDLKGYDVVLGKLVAASLGAFYGLLAMLPVLSVPLLLGGITSGEFWRVALVLVVTFLFSLSIGIAGSVGSRDARGAMAANFLLFLLFFVALPGGSIAVADWILGQVPHEAMVWSPLCALFFSDDLRYNLGFQTYWQSIATAVGLSALLLTWASWKAPRSWQDVPRVSTRKTTWREQWRVWNYGKEADRVPHRKALLDVNAFYWLAARAQRKPVHVWIFVGLAAIWWLWTWHATGTKWTDETITVTFAVLVNTTLKCWIAIEAGHHIAEDRKSGALELILSTPLTVRDILRGQFLALRRQFWRPFLLVLAAELLFLIMDVRHTRRAVTIWTVGVPMLVADVIVLALVAMRLGLTCKSPHKVAVSTITYVLILPWVLYGLGLGMVNLWAELFSPTEQLPGWFSESGLWFLSAAAVDFWFGRWAWRELKNFRQLAVPHLASVTAPVENPTQKFNSGPTSSPQTKAPTKIRHSKATMAVAWVVVIALLAGLFQMVRNRKPAFPPPVVVSLNHTNATFRAFAGLGRTLLLPDRSYWEWGRYNGLKPRKVIIPALVSTNCNWREMAGSTVLGEDGGLYDVVESALPKPISPDHDWVGFSGMGGHIAAIKANGTLWTRGYNANGQLGYDPGTNTTNFCQLGTNTDWASVKCCLALTMGIRSNGTLWIWGPYKRGKYLPLQFCRDTNWVDFCPGFGIWVQNRSGQVWQAVTVNQLDPGALADPEAPVERVCQLVAQGAEPKSLTYAAGPVLKIYQRRPNGTLWAKACPAAVPQSPGGVSSYGGHWQQVGHRRDWVCISGAGTVFGVTADGVVWTWGYDPSREESVPFAARVAALQAKILSELGSAPRTSVTASPEWPIQAEPRPLMRMIMPGARASAQTNPLR